MLAYVNWYTLLTSDNEIQITEKNPLKKKDDFVIPVEQITEKVFMVKFPDDLLNKKYYCLRRHRIQF